MWRSAKVQRPKSGQKEWLGREESTSRVDSERKSSNSQTSFFVSFSFLKFFVCLAPFISPIWILHTSQG
jgi:hypothetical protein